MLARQKLSQLILALLNYKEAIKHKISYYEHNKHVSHLIQKRLEVLNIYKKIVTY